MVQVLKEELRNKILQSAGEEFALHGVKGASMRKIAAKSYTTVGNLYRYYENKDAIFQAIITPAFLAVDQLVSKLSNNGISFTLDGDVEFNNDFEVDIKELSDGIVEIFNNNSNAMTVIHNEKPYFQIACTWINKLIIKKVANSHPELSPEATMIVAQMYSTALISGVNSALSYNSMCQEKNINLSRVLTCFFKKVFEGDKIYIKK